MNYQKEANDPYVQVIINCYNGDFFLKKALDSVFSQTYTNWGIVFFDNNSSDKSIAIAESYGDKLTIYRNSTTIPLGAARKKAIELCDCDYIAFLDVDDLWEPGKLEKQVCIMEKSKSCLSYTGYWVANEEDNELVTIVPKYKSGYLLPSLLLEFDIMPSTVLINKKLLDFSGLTFDENIHGSEEYDLFVQLAALFIFDTIEDPLCVYLLRKNSLTVQTLQYRAIDKEISLNKLAQNYPSVIANYKKEFSYARTKVDYYHMQYEIFKGRRSKAIKAISKIMFTDIRYFLIGLAVIFFPWVYFQFHRLNYKR